MNSQFMIKAINLAHQGIALLQGGPFGAVIVRDNMIVGQGYNCVINV